MQKERNAAFLRDFGDNIKPERETQLITVPKIKINTALSYTQFKYGYE